MKVKGESEVAQLFPTPSNPMYCSLQAPPSMGFSRQEYWSGVPLPSPSSFMVISNVPKWSGSVSLGYGGFWKEGNVEYSYNQPSTDM